MSERKSLADEMLKRDLLRNIIYPSINLDSLRQEIIEERFQDVLKDLRGVKKAVKEIMKNPRISAIAHVKQYCERILRTELPELYKVHPEQTKLIAKYLNDVLDTLHALEKKLKLLEQL